MEERCLPLVSFPFFKELRTGMRIKTKISQVNGPNVLKSYFSEHSRIFTQTGSTAYPLWPSSSVCDRVGSDLRTKMAPSRRLEDRIRTLCIRLAVCEDHEFPEILLKLKSAMNEYALRTQNRPSATVLAWPQFPRERRKA